MNPQSSAENETRAASPLSIGWLAAGLVWIVAFCTVFFSTRLPNNPQVTRPELLAATPRLLLDLISPLEPETAEERAAAAGRGWEYLPQRFPLWGIACALALGAWGWGALVLRSLRFEGALVGLERDVLALGVGLSAWSVMILGLGLAGMLSQGLVLGLVVVGAVGGVGLRWRRGGAVLPVANVVVEEGRSRPENVWNRRFSLGSWRHWLAAGCVPFLAIIALGAALPSTDFDVNEYHFGGPKEYFERGRIEFLPHNVYTSFPFLTEMLTLSGMHLAGDWFWGAIAGKCLLALFAPLTAMGLYLLGRRWGGEVAGWGAACVYLSTPWVYRYSTIAYVEGALACYGVLALLALVRAGDGRHTTWVFVAGVLAGSVMSCKYPGLVSVVVPCAVWLVFDLWRGVGKESARRATLAFVAGVVLATGAWLAKNVWETGNPVYPLAWSIFGGVDWDAELNEKWRRAHGPDGFRVAHFVDQIFDVSVRNDWLSPLLYALAPLALLPGGGRSAGTTGLRRVAWVAVWQFVSWWALTHRLDRFWTPMLPLVALLAGCGLARAVATISAWSSTGWRRLGTSLLGGVVVVGTTFNFVFSSTGLAGYNDFLRDLPQARAMAAAITMPEIVWLNTHLPEDARVLAVGDAEVFEARFPVRYNTVFDHSLFEELCGQSGYVGPAAQRPSREAAAILADLRRDGITHIYVNWSEILRYRTTYGYTDFVSPERFAALVEAGVLQPGTCPIDAWRPVEGLAPSWRDAVRKWGVQLVRTDTEGDVFPQWEVFAVAR
jgi:hypothetical protein